MSIRHADVQPDFEEAPAPFTGPLSRRRLLGTAALVTGAGLASLALPPNIRSALADTARRPTAFDLGQVKHVVLIMQENRSFDHYFGTLSGVRGFADPTAATLPDGRSVFYQPDSSTPQGYLLPYHLDTRTSAAAAVAQNDHNWLPMHVALDGGAMDDWIASQEGGYGVPQYTMGYYTREDIPFHFALAEAFTICDNYFCSVLGPTNANRSMYISGSIDPEGLNGGPAIDDSTNYTWTTYPEQLTAAGVSWKNYMDATSSLNPLHVFSAFKKADPGSVLYDQGMAISPGQFEYDVATGSLPTVSWITVPYASSEHPTVTPAAGAQYLYRKLDAIAANPEIWSSTVVIINYDENDGKFDHVVPPIPAPGTPDEFVFANSTAGTKGGGLAVGPAFRVPCFVVSPWTAGGYGCSDPLDHTSTLQFLGQVTGVTPENISAYRLSTFGDMTGVFQDRAEPPPVLRDTGGYAALTSYQVANFPAPEPPATQTFPVQEPGHRPHIG